MLTISELLSPLPTAAELFAKSSAPTVANAGTILASDRPKITCRCSNPNRGKKACSCSADAVAKSKEEVSIDGGASGHDLPDGSYERTIDLVRTPATRAVPCPGSQYGSEVDGQYHYPSVHGTYGDHVIVGCNACDRYWKVPYEMKDGDGRASVMVGEPEPRVRAFLAPNAALDAVNDPPFQPDENDSIPQGSPDAGGDLDSPSPLS